jgi:hypothetical protein
LQSAGRAGLIADVEEARDLLKAIVDDIALFGAFDRKTSEEARAKEIQKGRGFYQRRVAQELHGLYEEAIKARAERRTR